MPPANAATGSPRARPSPRPMPKRRWPPRTSRSGAGPPSAPARARAPSSALERLVGASSAAGEALTAARATLLLVQIRIDQRQGVIARGLLQRASRFLDGQAEAIERGHYAWMPARLALASGDAEGALAHGRRGLPHRPGAARRRRRVPGPDLSRAGLMSRGEVAEGLAQHDEAAAMIRLGGVCPWAAGWSLCSILYAARYRNDWLRAAQFAQAYEEWSRASRMPAFPGTCQLHRAAVLERAGRARTGRGRGALRSDADRPGCTLGRG